MGTYATQTPEWNHCVCTSHRCYGAVLVKNFFCPCFSQEFGIWLFCSSAIQWQEDGVQYWSELIQAREKDTATSWRTACGCSRFVNISLSYFYGDLCSWRDRTQLGQLSRSTWRWMWKSIFDVWICSQWKQPQQFCKFNNNRPAGQIYHLKCFLLNVSIII